MKYRQFTKKQTKFKEKNYVYDSRFTICPAAYAAYCDFLLADLFRDAISMEKRSRRQIERQQFDFVGYE